MIDYKGYTALLEVDVPSGTLVGHVIGIRDEIVFQGKTTEEAVEGFHQSVDFYLRRLAEEGQEPERPFSGRFNVRIDPETHRGLVLDAEARHLSLNDVVKRAFAAHLAQAVSEVESAVEPVGTRRGPRNALKLGKVDAHIAGRVGGGTNPQAEPGKP
jgi:predicted HicB family RNase H-like nuclease